MNQDTSFHVASRLMGIQLEVLLWTRLEVVGALLQVQMAMVFQSYIVLDGNRRLVRWWG